MHAGFKFHQLNERGQEKAQNIATYFNDLLTDLELHCEGSGREFAVCKTHLEIACFYAKKAMAMQKQNQIVE